ncbi:MAG TPA: Clp protease N-terminal domain-containing protein, partial [Verrucomicrobiae bacterium]
MKTQAALQDAQTIAHENSHQEIDGEHLLLALVRQEDSLIPPLLQKLGVQIPQLTADLNRELSRRVKVQGTSSHDVFWSNNVKKALDAADKEAGKLKDEYLSTEHLLLGLIEEGGAGLQKIFQNHHVTRDSVLKALVDLRGNQRVTDATPEDKFQTLEK